MLFGFLVAHDRHADTAVRMAAATELAPIGVRSMRQISKIGKRTHEADREPIAHRFANADLILYIVRQVRQRVALRFSAIIRYGFITAGKRDRLERKKWDLLRIVKSKLNHVPNLLIVHTVDDRDHRNDIDAVAPEIFD